jgi:EAL domain-containing protein (putative c-di-GMP-specific phosphodiesterase class I)/ActR/RegA family two-component response regulator
MATRILIVDDDELLLASYRRWLTRELRCEVHCATDRAEADALLDCYKYTLVVTDLSLSPQRLEGFDLVDRMANLPLRPMLIAMTGHGSEQIRSTAVRKGVDAFVEKPTSIKEVIAIARRLIGSVQSSPYAAQNPQIDGKLLATVLESPALQAFVQPIFRVADEDHRTLVGAECLTRGPAGTPFEQADALFAYARHKRAESALDRKCISLALAEVSGTTADIRISVNVHASTLGNYADFTEWLCATAAANAIKPERLTIEVVEHAPAWNKREFLRTLDSLRDAGIKIALDDVGLGQSNYQMMVDAHPDYFKIDRYFVHGCGADKYRNAVVASIVKLASDLSGEVVAEGVEAPEDLAALRSMGIELFQSFLFGRPIPWPLFKAENHLLCAPSPNRDAKAPEEPESF